MFKIIPQTEWAFEQVSDFARYCPLKKTTELFPSGEAHTYFGKCDREDCAWWSTRPEEPGCCIILSIAAALDQMLLTGLPVNT